MNLNAVQAILPACNEEAAVGAVVAGLRAQGLSRIRVVDNASRDATAARAREAGAEVVSEPRRGYGRACFTGAANLPPDVEWILFCDADGSDDLAALPALFAEADAGADLVLGDRRATPEGRAALTPAQNVGNALATTLLALLYGHRYRDLGPLRLIRREAYERLAMRDRGFGWTVEMQGRALEEKLRVAEVPVAVRPRQGGRSKISGTVRGSLMAGTIILATIWQLFARGVHRITARPVAGFLLQAASGALIVGGALLMCTYGDLMEPSNAHGFFRGAIVMGAGFALSWSLGRVGWVWLLAVAVLARVILLPMTPGDDIWRYVWEGRVQNGGFNPYVSAPNSAELAGLRAENFDWWAKINHPEVSAAYPPLAQVIFAGITHAAHSFHGEVIALKLAFTAADLLIAVLLAVAFGPTRAALYAWNPLIIYCFAGGGHFDALFLLPLVLAWLWDRRGGGVAATALLAGLAAAIKWMSLPALAFLALRGRLAGWRRWPVQALLVLVIGLAPLALCSLFFREAWEGFRFFPWDFASRAESAEFLDREILHAWMPWPGQRVLMPLLAGLLILVLAWRARRFGGFMEGYLVILFLLTPAIHAWYFTWLTPFAVASRNLGTRLVSLTGFAYFTLSFAQAADLPWELSGFHWALLWLPFFFGALWSLWVRSITGEPEV